MAELCFSVLTTFHLKYGPAGGEEQLPLLEHLRLAAWRKSRVGADGSWEKNGGDVRVGGTSAALSFHWMKPFTAETSDRENLGQDFGSGDFGSGDFGSGL